MIRNLKALMLATMALAVFGALAVSSAQAHTPAQFHSHLEETTLTVKTDGTGKTAHWVFDLPGGGSFTCPGVSGHGLVIGKTSLTIDVTLAFDASCTAFGQPATIHTADCVFRFEATGSVEIRDEPEKKCKLALTALGCEITFTSNKTYTGITYHNINVEGGATVEGTATYTTVSALVSGIAGTEVGAACPQPGAFTTAEFTTGNAIVEGEDPVAKAMTNIWWTPTVA